MLTKSSLFGTSRYSDVIIYLGKEEIKLPSHRVILGTQSPYFHAALTNGLKEDAEGEFHFSDDSVHALWRVFEFMYKNSYSDEPASPLSMEGKCGLS